MLNKVILMGRITNELEVRQTSSGLSVLRFSVAIDRPSKQGAEKQTDFISCTAFGQRAEFINRYFDKGRLIAIEGNLKSGSYEKNGMTIYTTEVWVDSVSFTGEKKADEGSTSSYRREPSEHDKRVLEEFKAQQAANNQQVQPRQQTAVDTLNDFEDIISDEGVPF